MAESTGYKHSDSDRKLDQSAESAGESGNTSDTQHSSGPRHNEAEIRKHDDEGKDRLFEGREQHDDEGKDRLFEGREQHDDAEKSSEKTRLARDVARHDHTTDEAGTE